MKPPVAGSEVVGAADDDDAGADAVVCALNEKPSVGATLLLEDNEKPVDATVEEVVTDGCAFKLRLEALNENPEAA